MKRLFEVEVSLTYVAYAENEVEAEDLSDIAMSDATHSEFDVRARPIVQTVKKTMHKSGDKPIVRACIPNGWDRHSLVYGSDDDSTLGELLDAEFEAAEEAAAQAAEQVVRKDDEA